MPVCTVCLSEGWYSRQQLLQCLVRRVCGRMAVPTTADVAAAVPDFFTDHVLEGLGNWVETSTSGDTVAAGAKGLVRVCRQQVQECGHQLDSWGLDT